MFGTDVEATTSGNTTKTENKNMEAIVNNDDKVRFEQLVLMVSEKLKDITFEKADSYAEFLLRHYFPDGTIKSITDMKLQFNITITKSDFQTMIEKVNRKNPMSPFR